jgi:hypothetical protein
MYLSFVLISVEGSETGRMGGKNQTRFLPSACSDETRLFIHSTPDILANQFRALEEDEIMFLDSLREKQEAEERQRKLQDGEEIKSFKQFVIFPFAKTLRLTPPVQQSGRRTIQRGQQSTPSYSFH